MRGIAILLIGVTLGSCTVNPERPAVGQSSSAIIGGTVTCAHPEVGIYHDKQGLKKCTATLIAADVLITAAHCVDYKTGPINAGFFQLNYKCSSHECSNEVQVYQAAESRSFGNGCGPNDIAVIRLTGAVPDSVASPAVLASSQPSSSAIVATYGIGCINATCTDGGGLDPGPSDNQKRVRSHPWKTAAPVTCPGDSGGPTFATTGPQTGQIVGISSGASCGGYDVYANPTTASMRSQVADALSAWGKPAKLSCASSMDLPTAINFRALFPFGDTEANDPEGNSCLAGCADWSPGVYKAQGCPNQALAGFAIGPVGPGLPGPISDVLFTGWDDGHYTHQACRVLDITRGSNRGTTITGSWGPVGSYLGECGADEYLAGVGVERGGQKLVSLYCCTGVQTKHLSCQELDARSGDRSETCPTSKEKWFLGTSNIQCGIGRYSAGISRDPATGFVNSILCCGLGNQDPLTQPTVTVTGKDECGATATSADPCSRYNKCDGCSAVDGCGWCSNVGQCLTGTEAGPGNGACAGTSWAWLGPECSACVPTTCAHLGKDCGAVADGCGGLLSCGSCAAPKTCGGAGTANVCGTSLFPNWAACSADSQCQSNWCGCNGAADKVCLPSTAYPKTCTLPNWAACSTDGQCTSKWCGCNGAADMVCLPSTAYPKTCTLPNWAACSTDGQCTSKWCGCNGGSDLVCLPSTAYPKTCTLPNWAACSTDGQCKSGWCGCNGGTAMVCLPSTAYPKYCKSSMCTNGPAGAPDVAVQSCNSCHTPAYACLVTGTWTCCDKTSCTEIYGGAGSGCGGR